LCSFEPAGLCEVDALADQVAGADARGERPWEHEDELARLLHSAAQRDAVRDQFFRGHLQNYYKNPRSVFGTAKK